MSLWLKFGCLLTGWSSTILEQCSEASKSKLSKYTSAMLILIIIWSVIGYNFAQRYVGLPSWGCCLVALAFVTIVIMIERQILLATHRSWGLVVFRGLIALVMAVVGSTIFDQMMFGKDIDKQMTNIIEEQTQDLVQKRVRINDEKLSSIQWEIDSLNKVNAKMQADVNENPLIKQKTFSYSQESHVIDGEIKIVKNPSVTTNQVANPKIETIKTNDEKVRQLKEREERLYKEKLNVEKVAREECQANVGFLEELEAMYEIVTTRPIAGAFYIIFFVLLMSLELFTVVSKVGDKECDYEKAVEMAEKIKMKQFELTLSRTFSSSSSNIK